ncbi:EutN/CcmL family microcompartment protein [Eubacteriales bacterium KG127]
MKIGTVVESIWATQKSDALSPYKLLQVEIDEGDGNKIVIAADSLDAGVGERVILVGGSGARNIDSSDDIPLDLTVIAIVDDKKVNN